MEMKLICEHNPWHYLYEGCPGQYLKLNNRFLHYYYIDFLQDFAMCKLAVYSLGYNIWPHFKSGCKVLSNILRSA